MVFSNKTCFYWFSSLSVPTPCPDTRPHSVACLLPCSHDRLDALPSIFLYVPFPPLMISLLVSMNKYGSENEQFLKEGLQVHGKYFWKRSAPLTKREMQITTTFGFHLSPVRMDIVKRMARMARIQGKENPVFSFKALELLHGYLPAVSQWAGNTLESWHLCLCCLLRTCSPLESNADLSCHPEHVSPEAEEL